MEKIVGIYRIWNAEELEGWTNDTLADALSEPMAEIGLGVVVENHLDEIAMVDGSAVPDILREQARRIFETVSTE
jgi:hypothetical protein